jgi:cytochrome o ubiquinol oxidase subunit 2
MSANYSGAGFADMVFNADAVPAERFAAWVTAARSGPVLDTQSYAVLAKPSQAVAPLTYGAVAPGLFGEIVSSVGTPQRASRSVSPTAQRAEK